MTATVVKFPKLRVVSTQKISAAKVLNGAKGKLDTVVVLGYDKEGELYAASTDGPGDTLWLIESAKAWILAGCPVD